MRVLVVEDEKHLNRIITEAMEDEGYSVDSCFNGADALDYALSAVYDDDDTGYHAAEAQRA